jgi:hypothetical protein
LNPLPATNHEALFDDILTISSSEIREPTLTNLIYDVLILGSITALFWAIGVADFFYIFKLLIWIVLLWAGINSLAPKLIVLNKANRSITISRTLFERWTIFKRRLPLGSYYGVRLRSIDGENVSYTVELVGKYGAALTLLKYTDLNEARDFRTSTAEWMGVKVVLDPSNSRLD